jgi:hypothetical protein
MSSKTLNQDIIDIRLAFMNANIKKSGKNKHSGFDYYELADFLPWLTKAMQERGINDIVSYNREGEVIWATLELVKDGHDSNVYKIPFRWFEVPTTAKGAKMMQEVQYHGATNTYLKRYLYLNAFGIVEHDSIDPMPAPEEPGSSVNESQKEIPLDKAKKLLSDTCKIFELDKKQVATYFHITASSKAKEYNSAAAVITATGTDKMNEAMLLAQLDAEQIEEVESNEAV